MRLPVSKFLGRLSPAVIAATGAACLLAGAIAGWRRVTRTSGHPVPIRRALASLMARAALGRDPQAKYPRRAVAYALSASAHTRIGLPRFLPSRLIPSFA